MSTERRRAREAREAARRAEVAEAARRRDKAQRRKDLLERVTPELPRRRRRYGALPTRLRYQLLVAFAVVQALAWWLLPTLAPRLAVAVLTAAVLLVTVKTRRSTPR